MSATSFKILLEERRYYKWRTAMAERRKAIEAEYPQAICREVWHPEPAVEVRGNTDAETVLLKLVLT